MNRSCVGECGVYVRQIDREGDRACALFGAFLPKLIKVERSRCDILIAPSTLFGANVMDSPTARIFILMINYQGFYWLG